ncbi:MAG: response regulator [Candidatus Omnitrophica bacterium]|nr:response regulator [Candidatus Omnitrophota bacterium]
MIKLLAVDDEQGICEIIEKTFSYIGFSVSIATNAKKAMQLFQKEKPKIVFLDLIMPDKDGEDLLKEMKAIDPGVIVIVVTAKKDEKAREQVLKLGVDEYITKPFSRNYLRDVVVQKIHDVLDKGGHMKPPRVLVVDDEVELRKNIKEYIVPRFECLIDEAQNAIEALGKVQQLKPDVILLDVKMPGLSGLDVIEQMRQASPASRIIVVSAWRSAEVVNKAISLGAVDYIDKSASLAVMGEKLRAVLLSIGKLIIKNV